MKTKSRVADIQVLPIKGPWNTKSGGFLNVLFNIPYADLAERFFVYDPDELQNISQDIRGLRSYHVSQLKKGSIGANEWHKIRNEIIFTPNGSIRLDCYDLDGETASIVIDQSQCAWVPPYIMHTYTALQDNTEIIVITNTLFDPSDASTHDTYSPDVFTVDTDNSPGNMVK